MGVTATYNGPYTRGYLQYIDLATYHTLVAVPGSTYTIAIASGWEVLAAIPADGSWTASGQPPALFSAVPGLAAPGAFFPASPGTGTQDDSSMEGLAAAAGPRGEDEAWAERLVASAGDPAVFGEIRERLASAGEKIGALRKRQGREP